MKSVKFLLNSDLKLLGLEWVDYQFPCGKEHWEAIDVIKELKI